VELALLSKNGAAPAEAADRAGAPPALGRQSHAQTQIGIVLSDSVRLVRNPASAGAARIAERWPATGPAAGTGPARCPPDRGSGR
jgi:hypothetical protein